MRYIFNGYHPFDHLGEENAQIVRELFHVTNAIACGVIVDAQNKTLCAIVTKEQGLLKLDMLVREGRIDRNMHTALAVQIMNCPHLRETTSSFKLVEIRGEEGCLYGLVTTIRRCPGPMRSKAAIRSYIESEMQAYRLHPNYAGRLLSAMLRTRLSDSLACIKGAYRHGDMYVVIHNNEGFPGKPVLFSKRQAIDLLNQLVSDGVLPAGMYSALKNQIEMSGLPSTHETDSNYFHQYGRDSALFSEFVH